MKFTLNFRHEHNIQALKRSIDYFRKTLVDSGLALGCLEPTDEYISNLTDVSHKVNLIEFKPDQSVEVDIELLPTSKGRKLSKLIEQGNAQFYITGFGTTKNGIHKLSEITGVDAERIIL